MTSLCHSWNCIHNYFKMQEYYKDSVLTNIVLVQDAQRKPEVSQKQKTVCLRKRGIFPPTFCKSMRIIVYVLVTQTKKQGQKRKSLLGTWVLGKTFYCSKSFNCVESIGRPLMGTHLTYMVSLIGQMSSHQRPRNRFNNLLACKRNWSNVSRDKGHGDSLRMLHIGHRLYMHSFRSNILRKTGCYKKQTHSVILF